MCVQMALEMGDLLHHHIVGALVLGVTAWNRDQALLPESIL